MELWVNRDLRNAAFNHLQTLTFDYFNRISERIVRFITGHSHISPERFSEYMTRTGELTQDVGSVLDGREAVECGLIDQLGSLSDALDYLHGQIESGPCH